jgi:hypothetical protein
MSNRGIILLTAVMLAGCRPVTSQEQAEAAMVAYFGHLAEGRYDEAATLYTGTGEFMANLNPDIESDDLGLLFERYCTCNGGVCLPVLEVVHSEPTQTGFRFIVSFKSPDGSAFSRVCVSACAAGTQQTEFVYQVVHAGGSYRLSELPPYGR